MMSALFKQGQSDYIRELRSVLKDAKTKKELYTSIVNAPFQNGIHAARIDLAIVVLLLVNEKKGIIERVALSETPAAERTVKISAKPFRDIGIPIGHHENIIAKAIHKGRAQKTVDWKYLFVPDMPAEAARLNQASAGIECSVVQPLCVDDLKIGALIFSFMQPLRFLNYRHLAFTRQYAHSVEQAMSAFETKDKE